jgi:glycosyltransferase involved in cell wall biosynthesis
MTQARPDRTAMFTEEHEIQASVESVRRCRLLYFGIIRPFKGVEDLLEGFGLLSEIEAKDFHLTVAGETWEGCTRPAELIANHQHRAQITFVNRYVSDNEVKQLFDTSDAVVLPYHRSSSSGPLLMAIGNGLPVMVTQVGGLIEAAKDYEGTVFVPPNDPRAIHAALPRLAALMGRKYPSPASWEDTAQSYSTLFDHLISTVSQ